LKKEEEVVLTVLNQAAKAAYSVQTFDSSCGKCRGKEGDSTQDIPSLAGSIDNTLYSYHFHDPFPCACQSTTVTEGTLLGTGLYTCRGSDFLPQQSAIDYTD